MNIQLVRVGNVYAGRTYSDRWNLDQLGITVIPADRNSAALKKIRRLNSDFSFTTFRFAEMVPITQEELAMFYPLGFSLRKVG